jgi:hypothetical protein
MVFRFMFKRGLCPISPALPSPAKKSLVNKDATGWRGAGVRYYSNKDNIKKPHQLDRLTFHPIYFI